MIWNSCLIISAAIFGITIIYAIYTANTNHRDGIPTPFNILFAGNFLAVFTGMIPYAAANAPKESGYALRVAAISFIQTIQVFTVNGDAAEILDDINNSGAVIRAVYANYMACLLMIAPILTFGFLISLFKNIFEEIAFIAGYLKDIYAFSELNEKSLLIAQNIRENHRNALIVFAAVNGDRDPSEGEYLEQASKIKALVFKRDLLSIDFMKHSKKTELALFSIGEKEDHNLIEALKLLDRYNGRDHTDLFVFSTGDEGELLLANARTGKVKVRRVNEARSMIYHFLYDEGKKLFETAAMGDQGRREIKVVIEGLGKCGTELLKALTWYCQMDGYSIEIHAFDKDMLAEEKFSAQCPELMSDKFNGTHIPGESEYKIQIHSGVDVQTRTFQEIIASISNITFAFVCLGDDLKNINQSANLRMLCERGGSKPVIKTIVYSTEEKEALDGNTNYRGQPYEISSICDLRTLYSEEIIIGSELERLALARHLKWGQEAEFWQYEYNYKSSLALAVHMKARKACKIPGAGKGDDLTPKERDNLERLEHIRWNAYMRSEGYVYSNSPEKSSRNDLGRMHHDLVGYELLTEEEKRKDSKLGSL